MIGLIRKDLYYLMHNVKVFLLVSLLIGIFLTMNSYGSLFIFFFPACMAISISDSIRNDSDTNWYDLYKSLPLSRTDIVTSRYLAFLIYTALGLLITFLYGFIAQWIFGANIFGDTFPQWKSMIYGCEIAFLGGSSYLPLTYYHRGKKMNTCILTSGLIGYFLYSMLIGAVSFMGFSVINDPAGITPLITLGMVSVYLLVSWFLSIHFYKKHHVV